MCCRERTMRGSYSFSYVLLRLRASHCPFSTAPPPGWPRSARCAKARLARSMSVANRTRTRTRSTVTTPSSSCAYQMSIFAAGTLHPRTFQKRREPLFAIDGALFRVALRHRRFGFSRFGQSLGVEAPPAARARAASKTPFTSTTKQHQRCKARWRGATRSLPENSPHDHLRADEHHAHRKHQRIQFTHKHLAHKAPRPPRPPPPHPHCIPPQ